MVGVRQSVSQVFADLALEDGSRLRSLESVLLTGRAGDGSSSSSVATHSGTHVSRLTPSRVGRDVGRGYTGNRLRAVLEGSQAVMDTPASSTVTYAPGPKESDYFGLDKHVWRSYQHRFSSGSMVASASGEEYQIQGRLGNGGMGDVYLAHDSRGQRVALKVIKAGEGVALHETLFSLRMSGLDTSHVVRTLDTSLYVDGIDSPRFIVQEFVSGGDLSKILYGLSEEEALVVFTQIAYGLSAIHTKGGVHRDIKPSNILMDGMTPKISDFGLARMMGEDDPFEDAASGSPGYMAPEQFNGEGDHRVDLYALGAMMFEYYAKKTAYEMVVESTKLKGAVLWTQIIKGNIPDAADYVPSHAVSVVRRLMQADPEHRYQSAMEVASDLIKLRMQLRRGRGPAHDVSLPYSTTDMPTEVGVRG